MNNFDTTVKRYGESSANYTYVPAHIERLTDEEKRLIDLGDAMENAFEKDGRILVSEYNSDGFFICDNRIDNAEELIAWHRMREVQREVD